MSEYLKSKILLILFLLKWSEVGFASININSSKIVGGYKCSIRNHPYMVAILKRVGGRLRHHCGGSILSKYWVVTAAHCMKNCKPNFFTVFAGASISSVNSNLNRHAQKSKVIECFPYDDYGISNDFGLLHLKSPIRQFYNVKYVTLATTEHTNEQAACKKALTMGWGAQYPKDEDGNPMVTKLPKINPYLQCLDTEVIPFNVCREKLGSRLSIKSFCAYTPGKDTCQGDSGGPFMCDGIQYGVVSWGIGCAFEDFPGAYTRVADFQDFVEQILEENSTTKLSLLKLLLFALFIASYLLS